MQLPSVAGGLPKARRILLFVALAAGASAEMLMVQHPQDARINVVWGQPAQAALAPMTAARPELSAAKSYGIVLENRSDAAIVALTVRWKWSDRAGRPRVHDVRSDSLFLTKANVVGPRQRVVILPGMLASDSTSGGVGVSGLPIEETLREFEGASNITASIDCLVFADGSALGPDESATVEGIKGRRRAALEIGAIVRSNAPHGKDAVLAALDQHARASMGKGSPPEQAWRSRLIRMVANHRGDLGALAESFINLPPVK